MEDTTAEPVIVPDPQKEPPTAGQRAQAALQLREQTTGHVDAHCRALTAAINAKGALDQPALVELESIAGGGKPRND